MYELKLTEEQAKIVSAACDFFSRVRMGQFGEIVWHTLDKTLPSEEYSPRREEAIQILIEARKQLYPELHGIGHSYGIGHFGDADIAQGVHQVTRHAMGDEREPFILHPLPEETNVTK